MSWDEAARAAGASFNSDELSRGRNDPNVSVSESSATKPKTKPAAPASKKRKAKASLEEDIVKYTQDLDEEHDPDEDWGYVDESCQKVRGKLMRLFDNGVMTKSAFCDAIATNNGTLNRFLTTKGTIGGQGSSIYMKAWVWFKQRERAGLKMPDPKRRKQTIANQEARDEGDDGPKKAATKKGASSRKGPELPDISGIYLHGQDTDEVPCFDTCDEVRRKINVHMKLPGVTVAQFCRDLTAQLSQPQTETVQSSPFTRFRNSKGPNTGAKSIVFYTTGIHAVSSATAIRSHTSINREESHSTTEIQGWKIVAAEMRTCQACCGG